MTKTVLARCIIKIIEKVESQRVVRLDLHSVAMEGTQPNLYYYFTLEMQRVGGIRMKLVYVCIGQYGDEGEKL